VVPRFASHDAKQVCAAAVASPYNHPVMPSVVASSPAMATTPNLPHTDLTCPTASPGRLSVMNWSR